ncbi:MAG: hypothetical protein HYY32_00730 [Chloroflexi bacterium]|nr:hypothetical protein [Chloroflexota bacterium]
MSKLVSRLYRDPADAKQAVEHLVASGYKAHDIGILARTEDMARQVLGGKVGNISFHTVAEHLVAAGCLIPALTRLPGQASKFSETLKEALGVGQEVGEYYEFGLGANGVLVVVQTEEAKAGEVRAILGQSASAAKVAGNSSPGFVKAGRMSSTNPVDATMTGDFRKY